MVIVFHILNALQISSDNNDPNEYVHVGVCTYIYIYTHINNNNNNTFYLLAPFSKPKVTLHVKNKTKQNKYEIQ